MFRRLNAQILLSKKAQNKYISDTFKAVHQGKTQFLAASFQHVLKSSSTTVQHYSNQFTNFKQSKITNKLMHTLATQKDRQIKENQKSSQGSPQKSQKIPLSELNKLFRLQWRKYNATTRIKLLNRLQTATEQQVPIKDRYQKSFFKQVIESINGLIPKVSQQSINQLLEIFSQRKIDYNRDIPIMHTICRVIIHSKNRILEPRESLITFAYIIRLKFPKTVIIKFINLIAVLDPSYQKLQTIFKSKQLLKFGMLAIEQNYIPLELTKGIVRCVYQQTYQKFQELALLYHFCQILPLSIQQKVIYQIAQRQVKQVLFNPYLNDDDQSQIKQQQKQGQKQGQDNKSNEQTKQTKSPQQKEAERRLKIDLDTKQLGMSIQKQFFSKISKQKLKSQILSKISSLQQEPSTKELCLLSGISQLRNLIQQHIEKNMSNIQPTQFMTLIRALPQNEYQNNLIKYINQMQQFMSMQQRIFVLLRKNQDMKIPIKLQQIDQLIEGRKKINYKQFVGLSRILALVQNDQQGVSRLIQKIDSLIDKQQA